jgi:protocatechuate 3,4-dioxygenase beta subunit
MRRNIACMNDDDAPQGVVLDRRHAIWLLGLAGAGALTTPALAACVVRPEQTAGPFFADRMPKRTDIRDGKPGIPLQLTLNVSQLTKTGCAPLAGAVVDLWHCDAGGEYSDATFLRGYQSTDSSGAVKFTTIYPGWYPGRTVHIHFKIRGGGQELASQLYFDDAITDRVHAGAAYGRRGTRRVTNARDGIYRDGGDQLMLALAESGSGFASTFDVALQR